MAGQDVQHHTGGMDVVRQRLGAGGLDGLDPVRQHGGQDLDRLPVAAGLTLQLALHASDRDRQIPFLEWRAVAQSTGFAGQYGDVMQRIVDGLAAPEGTCVLTDDPAVLPAFEPIGIGPDLDRPPHGAGIDRVAVVVEPDEAGLGHRRRHGVEPVEGADIGHEARALVLEHLPDRLVAQLWMFVRLGIGQAAILQPGVQLGCHLVLKADNLFHVISIA